MTDKEKIGILIDALEAVEGLLGIKPDFVPLGPAVPIAGVIQWALSSVGQRPLKRPARR